MVTKACVSLGFLCQQVTCFRDQLPPLRAGSWSLLLLPVCPPETLATPGSASAAGALFSEGAADGGGASEAPKQPTAQDIISQSKKGSINRVFPSEMLGKTMEEINKLAKGGDKIAQTARKLLTDGRFNKE